MARAATQHVRTQHASDTSDPESSETAPPDEHAAAAAPSDADGRGEKRNPAVLVAVLGVAGSVLAALAASPVLVEWVKARQAGQAQAALVTQPTATEDAAKEAPRPTSPPALIAGAQFGPDDVERVALAFAPDAPPSPRLDDFLHLAAVTFDRDRPLIKVDLVLTNVWADPIALDLNERFFALEDDRGNAARLAYFASATGGLLEPGQQRRLQMYFDAPAGWRGKGVQADFIVFRADGLLPALRAAWRFRTLRTAA